MQYMRTKYKQLQYAPNNTTITLTNYITLQYCFFALHFNKKDEINEIESSPISPSKTPSFYWYVQYNFPCHILLKS